MTRLIDLHTHSTASDGTDSPSGLVEAARKAGLTALALTDHDTTAGLSEAAQRAKELGLEFIRGCEVATESPYGEVHLLGLWLPEPAPEVEAMLAGLRAARRERNEIILHKLAGLGMPISHAELLETSRGAAVCRPHIASLMHAKGYVSNLREAFARFIGEDGPAYAPRRLLPPEEATWRLRASGASVVLAHPMLLKGGPEWLEGLLTRLIHLGLAALEVYHSEHDNAATRAALALAEKYHLVPAGGSDYHGAHKPEIRLGVGRGNLRLYGEILDKMKGWRMRQGMPV